MRQNTISVFHKVIIASLSCIILVGCGYKTNPIYVDENIQNTKENKKSK